MTLRYHTPLSAGALAAQGVTGGWPFGVADRVRFGELDALGHVNNAAFLTWFESARIDYFRDWGISAYRAEDPRLVLRRAEVEYLSEMYLGEDYIVTARTARYRRTSFTKEYAVWSDGLRATGTAVVVMLEPDGSARRDLPGALLRRFRQFDGAAAE